MIVLFIAVLALYTPSSLVGSSAIYSRVNVVPQLLPYSLDSFSSELRASPREDEGLGSSDQSLPPPSDFIPPEQSLTPSAVSPYLASTSSSNAGSGESSIAVAESSSATSSLPTIVARDACEPVPAGTIYVTQTVTQTTWETQTVYETQTQYEKPWQSDASTATTTSDAAESNVTASASTTAGFEVVQPPFPAYNLSKPYPTPQGNCSSCSSDAMVQRHLVANYDSLPVSNNSFNPFDYSPYLGLNYTNFNVANNTVQANQASPPNYIISQAGLIGPRQIEVQPPFASFSLLSFVLACSHSIPQLACNIIMYGIKAATTTAGGAAAGGLATSSLVYPPITVGNGTLEDGFDMIQMQLDRSEWSNLTRVSFVAQIGGEAVDLLIDDLEYNLVGKESDLFPS